VYPDHLGFIMGPTIMVAALLRSRLSGKGVSIDLAQIEGTAYTLGVTYLDAAVNESDPQPKGNSDPVASPHGCYPCRGDDRWCAISVRNDEEWRIFCRVIDRPELLSDARFVDRRARAKHRSELNGIVQQWTEQRSAEEVMNQLQSAGMPAGVVQTGADLLKDAQLRHRNYFASFSDSLIGPFEIPRSGFVFQGVMEEPLRLPSRLGSDNGAILGEILGYDQATIDQWRAEEVLT
jgi:crotonobetainyl-CoA:carnitine CoA-transferase CaiB-like acyl-CoA transferase